MLPLLSATSITGWKFNTVPEVPAEFGGAYKVPGEFAMTSWAAVPAALSPVLPKVLSTTKLKTSVVPVT